MRSVNIYPEEVDQDVCYGDYDGFITVTTWAVDMFDNGVKVSTSWLKTEEYAKATAQKFVEFGFDGI